MTQRKNGWTQTFIDLVHQDRDAGYNMQETGDRRGVSRSTVSRILNRTQPEAPRALNPVLTKAWSQLATTTVSRADSN